MFYIYSEVIKGYLFARRSRGHGWWACSWGTLHGKFGEGILDLYFLQWEEVVKHQDDVPKICEGEGGDVSSRNGMYLQAHGTASVLYFQTSISCLGGNQQRCFLGLHGAVWKRFAHSLYVYQSMWVRSCISFNCICLSTFRLHARAKCGVAIFGACCEFRHLFACIENQTASFDPSTNFCTFVILSLFPCVRRFRRSSTMRLCSFKAALWIAIAIRRYVFWRTRMHNTTRCSRSWCTSAYLRICCWKKSSICTRASYWVSYKTYVRTWVCCWSMR